MHTEPHGDVRPHRKQLATRMENLIPVLMLIAVAILGVGLVWGLMNGGTPSYLQ
jgi:hypothetical protein